MDSVAKVDSLDAGSGRRGSTVNNDGLSLAGFTGILSIEGRNVIWIRTPAGTHTLSGFPMTLSVSLEW